MNDTPKLTTAAYEFAERCAYNALPLFQQYGWTYWNGAPTVSDLADTVVRLMEAAIQRGPYCPCSMGRFSVWYAPDSGTCDQGYFEVCLDLGWEEK